MTFKEQLSAALNNIQEGHHYLRKTGKDTERQLNRVNVRAMRASGFPQYPDIDNERKAMLQKIEQQRPLRRSEFIDLYGYAAWREYIAKNNLPEDHKWADAR